MEQTPNLSLPYIMASQAQKHVTHNDAIRKLDILAQIVAKNRNSTTPPAQPVEGQVFIVAPPATGEWAGREN